MNPPAPSRKIHLIAIGGSVMHQLAIALKNNGFLVTGSDDELFEPALSNLAKAGLLPSGPGWDPSRVRGNLEAVILGMHARHDNPELLAAKNLGLPLYSFPEFIRMMTKDKTRVVVGGSHGKTTVTSMIMHVLKHSGMDFDYLVGARLEGFDNSVRLSNAPVFICEGDEYPASVLERRPKFHFFQPHIAIITGIAWDHVNVFPTFENYLEQFAVFIEKIETGGSLIYNDTDPELVRLVHQKNTHTRLIPYQLPMFRIAGDRTEVTLEGETVVLEVFGRHNLLNLEAARLACLELGIQAHEFLTAIRSFRGASKRLELVARGSGSAIYRDFAHAPSKVRAAVHAVRHQFPEMELVAVLELHTFSSLNRSFLSQYAHAMDEADTAAIFYSDHALEMKRLPPLDPSDIREGFGRNDLHICNTLPLLLSFLDGIPLENTVLLMMSSGNFGGLDLEKLSARLGGDKLLRND